MERENQRIAITKRLLKESLLRLLNEKELNKISVTELCRDAGINRATFYRHYEIPRDVLIEIEKDLYYDLKQTIVLPSSYNEIKSLIVKLCSYLEQHIDMLRTIIRCNSDTDFAMLVNDIYMEIWYEYRDLSIFNSLDAEDMKLLTLYSAGGSYFIMRHWLLGNIHKSSEQMADYLYSLLNKTDWTKIVGQMGLIGK